MFITAPLSSSKLVQKVQFVRMRLQVDLVFQVFNIQFSYVMPDQRDRHNQRKLIAAIPINQIRNFRPVIRRQLLAEIAGKMLQHVRVISPRRRVAHDIAERVKVVTAQLLCGYRTACASQKITETSHTGLRMRHEQELMLAME